MASTWHLPGHLPAEHDRAAPPTPSSWWARHWADPMFSGGVIAVVSVLLVIAAGLSIGVAALHVDLGHLGFKTLLGR